jgi:hypothetical protein
MAVLTIASGLAGFQLVQRISEVSDRRICGRTTFRQAPVYAGLEALAQLSALDVRRRAAFGKHAFLLKIIYCRWPATRVLEGCFTLQACPGSQSSRACVYNACALGPEDFKLETELIIATQAYDLEFEQAPLQNHYRKLFACLQNASSKN